MNLLNRSWQTQMAVAPTRAPSTVRFQDYLIGQGVRRAGWFL
jgi:hypothetical protein